MAGSANSIVARNVLRGRLSEDNLMAGAVGTAYDPTYAIVTEAGAQIVLYINSSNYQFYAELKDKYGNHISNSNIIDLPLESMVVDGSYDAETKEVVLILNNGNEVRFSVADLVEGLVSTEQLNTILSGYVQFTDYATAVKAGVIKISDTYATAAASGVLTSQTKTYEQYNLLNNDAFISKGTLENVITGKELTNKEYVDAADEIFENDLFGDEIVSDNGENITLNNTTDASIKIELKGNTQQDTAILPSEYQQVEYIQNSSGCYIDTNFIPKQNTNVELKAEMLYSGTRYFFGVSSSSNRYMIAQRNSDSNLIVDLNSSDYRINSGIVGYETGVHTIKIQNKSMYVDGVLKGTSSCPDFTCDYPAYLFGTNNGSTAQVSGQKIYYFKMWDNTTLVRNMIPCYRKSDNVIGMYDLVNNVFYTNVGSGEFTKGNNATLPNPDYPQDIQVVSGDNTIKIYNANLFSPNAITSHALLNSETGETEYHATSTVFTTEYIPVKEGVTYYGNYVGVVRRCFYDTNKNFVSSIASESFTASANGYIRQSYNTSALDTIQIKVGNSATPFIEHKEQSYSVNLGPLELCKIGDYKDKIAKSTGKNLFDITNPMYINRPLQADGVVSGSSSVSNVSQYIQVQENTNYTLSLTNDSNSRRISFYSNILTSEVTTSDVLSTISYEGNIKTFETPTNCKYIRFSYYNSATNVQLEKGTQATSYEPYGKVWYLNKQIGKVVLDGSESWQRYTDTSKPIFYMTFNGYKKESGLKCYSNYFKGEGQVASFDNVYDLGNNVIAFRTSYDRLVIRDDSITDVTDWTTWLSNNNVTVYYVLEVPTYTEITDTTLLSQLNALEKAKSYDEQTNISQVNNDMPFELAATAFVNSTAGKLAATAAQINTLNETDNNLSANKEDKLNKVTTISASSTDTEYPTAKCVYDLVGDVESLLEALDIGSGV